MWLYFKHGLFCSRLRGKSREAGKGERISNRRSLVCMFSLRAKGAAFRFYHKRRPSIFQSAHRCEAAYKNSGKAATTTLPPFWYCVPPFYPHIGRATKGKRLYFLVSP